MCFPLDSCTLHLTDTHWSASWINQDLGTQAVLPVPSQVGIVLDPSRVQIQCLYPTDAASAFRIDDQGCGPWSFDTALQDPTRSFVYQGQEWQNASELKQHLIEYKDRMFGRDTAWNSLDCTQFLDRHGFAHTELAVAWEWTTTTTATTNDEVRRPPALRWHKQDSLSNQTIQAPPSSPFPYNHPPPNNMTVIPYLTLWYRKLSTLLGHSVCNASTIYNSTQQGTFVLYSGARSWPPEQWQTVVDWQQTYFPAHSQQSVAPVAFQWNEVVLALPDNLLDTIQAVFYRRHDTDSSQVVQQRQAVAQQQAQLLTNQGRRGRLPILEMTVGMEPGRHDKNDRPTTTKQQPQEEEEDILSCVGYSARDGLEDDHEEPA